MKVILKFPIYVSIETDNVDRAKVTKAARDTLYPILVDFVVKQRFKSSVIKTFLVAANVPKAEVQFLTEIDLVRNVEQRIDSNDV